MRSSWRLTASVLLTLIFPSFLVAQSKQPAPPQYALHDVGNLSDFSSWLFFGPPSFRLLNHKGIVVDAADTGKTDPYHPCFTDCSVNHAVRWKNGVLKDLKSLPQKSKNSSAPLSISESGQFVVGLSENGSKDPLTNYPAYEAVLWQSGHDIHSLGTLGGSSSTAVSVNDLGQVVGGATNDVADQYAAKLGPCWSLNCWPSATQWRAYLWQSGVLMDLGTLGTGNDAIAGLINESGQVAGVSYTNTTANETTGVPTQDPFFWEPESGMIDAGTLGGTRGFPISMNNSGQMVGQSNLPGDNKHHPFVWEKSTGMVDLGTLGGRAGTANWINDAGEIVGGAWTAGNQAFHAVLWKDGIAQDLGVLHGFQHSIAQSINSQGQIVGCVTNDLDRCARGFLWQNGKMYDLNDLTLGRGELKISMPLNINDRGEIATWGSHGRGSFTRAILLTPQ
jgi:probable HAF family extracellular repeat protein